MPDYLLKDITHNPLRAEVFAWIDRERREQIVTLQSKWCDVDPASPGVTDSVKLGLLTQDVGYVARTLNTFNVGLSSSDERTADLREGLLGIAATATAWLESIAEEARA